MHLSTVVDGIVQLEIPTLADDGVAHSKRSRWERMSAAGLIEVVKNGVYLNKGINHVALGDPARRKLSESAAAAHHVPTQVSDLLGRNVCGGLNTCRYRTHLVEGNDWTMAVFPWTLCPAGHVFIADQDA